MTPNTKGRALDGVVGLPLLSSLDLSYNNLEVNSLLAARPATHPKLTRGEPRVGRGVMPQISGDWDEVQCLGSSSPGIDGSSLNFHGKFAAVEHLDLSWNCLCDLDQLVRVLRQGIDGSCENHVHDGVFVLPRGKLPLGSSSHLPGIYAVLGL